MPISCQTQGVLAQSPEPEAHDEVLDNSRLNRNLEMVVFEERGKPEDPEQGRATNNKLNPHKTSGQGIEPGTYWWEASALTTAPSLLSGSYRGRVPLGEGKE